MTKTAAEMKIIYFLDLPKHHMIIITVVAVLPI